MCNCGSISREEVRLQPPGIGAGRRGRGKGRERKKMAKKKGKEMVGMEKEPARKVGGGGGGGGGGGKKKGDSLLKCMSFQNPLTIHWYRHSSCQYGYALVRTVCTALNTGSEIVHYWL